MHTYEALVYKETAETGSVGKLRCFYHHK